MANNSPTIVAASLSDDQLKKSIDSLVTHVDEAMKKMVQSTNNAVGEMEAKLKSLGNLKIDSGVSADGGASKRTKAQNAETDAVEKNVAARDKQIKKNQETAMSFDQIAAALDKARRTVSDFNTKRASGILPSSDDYKRYEQALARIVEYNDKLKQSALSRADANQRANVFDAKATIRDLTAVDDRYKKLVRWYTVLEKEDQRRIARDDKDTQKRIANAEKERAAREKMIESARKAEQKYQDATLKSAFRGALTLPTNNIDELRYKIERITTLTSTLRKEGLIDEAQVNRANAAVAKLNEQLNKQLSTEKEVKSVQSQQTQPQVKSARDSYIAFMQGYKQQAEQVRRLMEEEQKAMQQRRQGVVDGFTKTIEERKARIKELSEEVAKLYKERPDGYRDAIRQRTEEMNALKQKIRELSDAQKNLAETPIGASNRYLELEKEYNRIKNIMIDTTNVQRQSTQETEKQTQSAQRYTEEIRKQAQAIRESQQWKEKGFVTVGNDVFYDPARSKAQTLSLEEQMLNAENRRIEAQEKLNAESQKEVEIKSQLPKQGYLFDGNTRDESSRQQQSRAALERYKQIQQEEQNVNSLNAAIMRSLHIGKDEVKNYDIRTASAKQLNAMLKQQRDAYANLTTSQRSQKGGVELAESIQRTGRALQKLQAAASRPISLQFAMGLSEKTLDEMAYKMRQLASYRSGLNVKTQANEIEQVNRKYAELQKSMNDIMRKNTEMIKSNTALGRSWNYMKNRLAFYFTVGASTQFVKNLIEVRSQYEMNERALGILINSAERGTQIFNELSQMALVSPYTLIELSTAAKQLTAYDVAAKDVVDTTRRLADMASAVGIPIERLTYALGQIKAYGYLNSRDARMFANAGIPLVKQLSDYYTQLEGRLVSTADVYDRIKKKTIDYEQVVQVINKMTDEGGKFFDFQAKMADTLKVRLANLTLAWNNMLNDMGSSNQGVLTTGIGLLRDMFLHWKDLESAISKVATAFGIYKTAQLVTLIWTGRITTAMGVQELVGKKLQARFASLTIAQKGFVSAATAGWAALAFIVADAWLTISRNMEEIEQLNKSIADGAKESYEAIDKMLHSSEMASTRLSAAQGKLSDTDAAKAWEMLREQIELSAASSKELIAQLIKEPDLNKRVTESFNLAEKIEEANRKLSDLNDSLDVSQNSILGGLFGEGLVEDIDDYNARIKYTSDVAEWASKKNRGFWENAAMGLRALFNEVKDSFGSDANEAQDEIKNFAQKAAQTIKDELGEEGIKDKIQVNEAIARVVRGMEQQFPQIRGKGKVLFETIFYDTMAKEFKGAVDGQAYYYEKFLEQLKKDHAGAFSGVTEDINKETFKWSSAQIDAIQKTADKVKKDLPAASQGAIDEILRQLNSTDFKVRIVAEMATTSLDNVQKQFREKFIEKPWIADDKEREKEENEANQRYGTLMRKNTESNAEYEKRISDERKKQLELSQKNADIITKNKGKQEEFSKAVLADAQKQKEAADDWLKAAKDIEDKGGYDFSTKGENSAARKAAKQAESELAKALKDELSTIDKVRSIYKDLTKEGMSHANAVERATKGWDETVNAINRVLQKNGLQKLDLSKFAGIENPRELVNMLQSQLNTLLKRGAKPAEIKELQTKVNTLEVDADKYDLTKITKGLNNELGKLKDEYELAVELDANPELGGMFADMLGIDTSTMSHSIDEYMDNVRMAVDKARMGLGYGIGIDIFGASEDEWQRWAEWVGISNEKMQEFRAMFEPARSVVKKWATDTVNNTKKLEYELAELNDKIAIKEKEQALLHEKIEKEKNETTKHYLELTYQSNEKSIDELRAQALSLMPEYARVFNSIAEYSAGVSRRLQRDLMRVFDEAKYDSANKKWTLTGSDGKQTILNDTQYRKEREKLTKEMRKSQSPFKKIKEAFKPSDKNGVVDYAKGIELVSAEVQKLGNVASEVGNLAQIFGADEQTVEIINDVATSLNGVATAGQGISQIASGDYIGGAASVLSGITSIIGAWADNSNKKIDAEIKDSERAVKRLELTYKNLEVAIENAYGANVIGAKQAAIANKELQLAELKRQLALEKSRDSKKRDDDRIMELQGQIIDMQNDIKRSMQEIATELLGISSVGDAALSFMDAYISALRKGEDAQAAFTGSWKEMIANMIKQLWVTKVIGPQLEALVDEMNERIKNRSKKETEDYKNAVDESTRRSTMSDGEIRKELAKNHQNIIDERYEAMMEAQRLANASKGSIWSSYYESLFRAAQSKYWAAVLGTDTVTQEEIDAYKAESEKSVKEAKKKLDKATTPAIEDMDMVAQAGKDLLPLLQSSEDDLNALLERYGLFENQSDKTLSALQQGIQGITEDTAGALEAITNGISQQCYLQSDILTQIRDTVQSFDIDIQTASLSQILLQLQSSYQLQQSMLLTMENWTNPSGNAVRVELIS